MRYRTLVQWTYGYPWYMVIVEGDTMPSVILTNVRLCNNTVDGQERVYVANSGKLASVSDRVDLRCDTNSFKCRPESVQLDSPRVDRENGGDVVLKHPER